MNGLLLLHDTLNRDDSYAIETRFVATLSPYKLFITNNLHYRDSCDTKKRPTFYPTPPHHLSPDI
jgi:hypothetical protein